MYFHDHERHLTVLWYQQSTCAVLINNSKDDPYIAVTSINNDKIS